MNKKMILLAFGLKCGGLVASWFAAPEPAARAWDCPSMPASARFPNPAPASLRTWRREIGNAL
jgi:hypothetical protein